MAKIVCERCEENKAEYRVDVNLLESIYVCDDCLDEDDDYIPLDELEMDEEEESGWEDICDYYNK